MVIREYCSVTGRLGSVKIYNSRSEYPFVRKVRMRDGGGEGEGVVAVIQAPGSTARVMSS